jgi:hypothetical protein
MHSPRESSSRPTMEGEQTLYRECTSSCSAFRCGKLVRVGLLPRGVDGALGELLTASCAAVVDQALDHADVAHAHVAIDFRKRSFVHRSVGRRISGRKADGHELSRTGRRGVSILSWELVLSPMQSACRTIISELGRPDSPTVIGCRALWQRENRRALTTPIEKTGDWSGGNVSHAS